MLCGLVEKALTINRTTTGIDRLQTLGVDHRKPPIEVARQILVRDKPNGKPENATNPVTNPMPPIDTTLWEDWMAGIDKGLQELKPFQQTASTNAPAGGYEYRPMVNPRGRLYHPPLGRNTANVMTLASGQGGASSMYGNCRWCGGEGHLKYQCTSNGKSLSEGIVHFIDRADQKTRMEPAGSGGVVVPLPESTGV